MAVLSPFLYVLPSQEQTNNQINKPTNQQTNQQTSKQPNKQTGKQKKSWEMPQLHMFAAKEMDNDLFAILGLPWLPCFVSICSQLWNPGTLDFFATEIPQWPVAACAISTCTACSAVKPLDSRSLNAVAAWLWLWLYPVDWPVLACRQCQSMRLDGSFKLLYIS
jgi:hypothetical protein